VAAREKAAVIRVIVADDHAVVRRGVLQIIGAAGDMAAVGEACSAAEALRVVQQHDCDVLVLDVAMPGGGGFEVLTQLRGLKPHLPVLMLSMYPEKQYAVRALKAGAAGYLTKDAAPDELLDAIRAGACGERYVTPALADKLVALLRAGRAEEPQEALSDREYQVLRLLGARLTVTEIAAELSLSVKTVSTYRARILEKLDLRNTAEIIHYALTHGLSE
jgi:two-component system, NarL family, invasion response regulator UvrY